MTTTTRNEAAERLRAEVLKVGQREFGWSPRTDGLDAEWDLVDEALAAERRATVNRIRERLPAVLRAVSLDHDLYDERQMDSAAAAVLAAILDEEAAV